MTSTERLEELAKMGEEFDAKDTTNERRIEILTRLRDIAEEEMPESRCQFCRHTGIYAPFTHALIEGHCYSHEGMVDYTRVTMVCEFCFDNLPRPEEEENEFGLMVDRKDAEARNDDWTEGLEPF